MSNETPKDPVATQQRTNHIAMLMERVLQVARWPHYQLLLDDLMELADEATFQRPAKILSLERTLLYGGKSLFAPIFYGHDYRIREASPETAYERGPYNEGMLDGRFMAYGKPMSAWAFGESFDLVIMPNALHHIPLCNSNLAYGTFKPLHVHKHWMENDAKAMLRPGGYLYIFEQFIEEIHQKPDDYVRYTPDGLASLLQAAGYQIQYVRTTGNIFTCTQFLLDNVLEYIEGGKAPEGMQPLDFGMAKAEDIRRIQGMIKTLQKMAPNYPTNGLRKYTECPKAFSVLARKPV